ncbi:MAG: NAD(P)H-hydrate dehydratase [Planctomycetaceae bacterium]
MQAPDLPRIPERERTGHKGSYGRVLIIAGSRGMSGAAALAGSAALRGGAGLVYVATAESLIPIVAGIEPSYLTIPLPEDAQGKISVGAQRVLWPLLSQYDAIAVGPGLGQSDDLFMLVQWLYQTVSVPLVCDADALNLLSRLAGRLPKAAGPRILTPHPGEFSRLSRTAVDTIAAQRSELAGRYAKENGIVLVLKGAGTVITDGTRTAVNTTGNPGMATGGTGDVLTGLIAALLAQQIEPFAAAQLGVYLHGLAGDLAAAELSEPGLIASDLPRYLGRAWTQYFSQCDK